MISTHVLDLIKGQPAQGIVVELDTQRDNKWVQVAMEKTNSDGRVTFQAAQEAGYYRLNFLIGDYLKKTNANPFFTVAPVIFEIQDTNRKYHVPLLLSAYGYSTYRGS